MRNVIDMANGVSAREIESRANSERPELRSGSNGKRVGGLAVLFNRLSHNLVLCLVIG